MVVQANNNITGAVKTSSDGAWGGDNPLNYAFPLLIIQTTLVLFTTRFLAFLLKPFRQPKVVAEILGGILLGPSALGRSKRFTSMVFPGWSLPILETVASIGLLFFLFLVGLELDLSSIRRSGRKALGIALAGISIPFLFAVGITFLLKKAIHGEEHVDYRPLLVFMGVALSITAFPVLARILAELKLLTTQVGETAMAAAAFNDVVAWVLLVVAVAVAGGSHESSPLVSVWVVGSGIVFVGVMLFLVRPVMEWVDRRCSSERDFVDDVYMCVTLAGVMLSGFITDVIGIHAIFGAFVFGLTIPKGGEFASRLIKRIEDFVSGLLLPLYFASSGLKTDVGKIRGAEAWGILVLVTSMACTGKILGTFVVAMLCMIPPKDSLALGVLMNTKGLVELIVLNIGKEKKVLNDEIFAILVLMALFTTFMTTPTVMAIYRPSRHISSQSRLRRIMKEDSSLRILACVHGSGNVPSIIKLIDLMRIASTPMKLYAVHLVELTNQSSSILMVHSARRNGLPFINNLCIGSTQGQVAASFHAYSQVGLVKIRHSTAISALLTMHEDIYHVAEEKRVTMIILPFHKQWKKTLVMANEDEAVEIINMGHNWREVNQRVLEGASCTVVVFLDRGLGTEETVVPKRVCVIFFGGSDDREALEFGRRVVEHSSVRVTLIRFTEAGHHTDDNTITTAKEIMCMEENETELDEAALSAFIRHNSVNYIEKVAGAEIVDELLEIGRNGTYDLVVVGKGQFPTTIQSRLLERHVIEHQELGFVGDILAQSNKRITPSILVVQQYQPSVLPNPTMVVQTTTATNVETCA